MIGAIAWMGSFLALAIGHAHGDEWAAALAHLATALPPAPPPLPAPVLAPSVSCGWGAPGMLFLVLAGLLLGGGALCVWLGDRARPSLVTEDTD